MTKYYSEILIGLTVAFLVYLPPRYGVALALIVAGAMLAHKWLSRQESPELKQANKRLLKLESDLVEVSGKLERIFLKGVK